MIGKGFFQNIPDSAVPDSTTKNELSCELADELRIEGICCHGYGTIAKLVMLDSALTVEAKAIYAYFCAYSGAGSTAFPGREKILADLQMSKDAYYKHYHLLIENGYLTVKQHFSGGRQFQNNVYTLVSKPEKFSKPPEREALQPLYGMIRASGLKAGGYGMIPKAVMTDRRLSVKAKGLYAYYAAYTGSGESAYPEKSLTMAQLKIGVHCLERITKELITYNLIVVRQRHINGRLSVNDVYLVDHPDEKLAEKTHQIRTVSDEKQDSQIQDTEQRDGRSLYSKKQDTEKQECRKQDTEKPDTKKNQSNNKQILIKNNYDNLSEALLVSFRKQREEFAALLGQTAKPKKRTAKERQLENKVLSELFIQRKIPLAWCGEKKTMSAAIRLLLDDDRLSDPDAYRGLPEAEQAFQIYCLFRDCLLEILTNPAQIGEMSAEEACQHLQPYLAITPETLTLELRGLPETVMDTYREAAHRTRIRASRAYMKKLLLDTLLRPVWA